MARVKYLLVLSGRDANLERFRYSLPRDTLEEWLVVTRLDGPVSNWDSHPVQSGSSDIGKVLLGLYCQLHHRISNWRVNLTDDEGLVVLLHDFGQVVRPNPVKSASNPRNTWKRLTLVIVCIHRWLWVSCSGIVRTEQVR